MIPNFVVFYFVFHYINITTLDIFDLLAFSFARSVIPSPLHCAFVYFCFKHCIEVSPVKVLLAKTLCEVCFVGMPRHGVKVDILVLMKESNNGLLIHCWTQLTHPIEISISYACGNVSL